MEEVLTAGRDGWVRWSMQDLGWDGVVRWVREKREKEAGLNLMPLIALMLSQYPIVHILHALFKPLLGRRAFSEETVLSKYETGSLSGSFDERCISALFFCLAGER